MKYTLDTEFWEHGHMQPLKLISIGIVSELGQRYYAVNQDFDWTKLSRTSPKHWLFDNVKPKLYLDDMDKTKVTKPLYKIREDLLSLFKNDPAPAFWAWFADYDWVLFCQIFGTMLDLPKNMPQMCMDIEQKRIMLGLTREVLGKKSDMEHNALVDAIWDMQALKNLEVFEQKYLSRPRFV
jgi:hypothetical protein